jgi:hypothetical protein
MSSPLREELQQLHAQIRELCMYLCTATDFSEDCDLAAHTSVFQQSPLRMLTYVRLKVQDVLQQSRTDREGKSYQQALQQLEADCRRRAKAIAR